MIRIRRLIRAILEPTTYIWINVTYVCETPKAILIIFDGREAWIPKAWLCRIKRNKGRHVVASPAKRGEAISIKISDYHWAKKFV
jgi:hypothetical protein